MTDSNDFGKEVGLIHRAIVTGRKVGADRSFWVRLSEDEEMFRRVVKLVCSNEEVIKQAHPEPTIVPLTFAGKYSDFRRRYPKLVQAREAMQLDCIAQNFNDWNFPPEDRDSDPALVLVCYHRDIDDHEDPAKSELLRELDKLGLQLEGPMELSFVGTDEQTRDYQRNFPIVARRQFWRDPFGDIQCPILVENDGVRYLDLSLVQGRWHRLCRFLASRK